ncbi:MAG: PEP-CTERM sorting domain-containing protein [Thermoguttaceae bacterium]
MSGDVTAAAVPEPSTLVLLGIAAVGLLGYAWRQRQRSRV